MKIFSYSTGCLFCSLVPLLDRKCFFSCTPNCWFLGSNSWPIGALFKKLLPTPVFWNVHFVFYSTSFNIRFYFYIKWIQITLLNWRIISKILSVCALVFTCIYIYVTWGCWVPWKWSCELLCGFWTLNSGPWGAPSVLLTTEPSLQPPISGFKLKLLILFELVFVQGER